MADAISMQRLRAQAVDAYKESGQTDILTYPEGEPDAVTITDSDMDGLQPGEYLSDNIIDFYIKYLQETRLSSTDRDRFYFFNSFFFTKLLESSSASADSDECRIDFGQLRKWTQGVDLFEKEHIFIPVIRRSLVTRKDVFSTCCGSQEGSINLSMITLEPHLDNSSDEPEAMPREESKPSPCIYHLDSYGRHESFEGKMKSYLFDAFMDGKDAINKDQFDQVRALTCMRYVEAKVPQQDNKYDCGVHAVQYVEDILDLLIASSESRWELNSLETYFAKWNTSKVYKKREHIKKLILEMSGAQEIILYVKPCKSQGIPKHSNEGLDKEGNAYTHESMKNAILVEEVAEEDLEVVAQEDVEMERGEHHSNGGMELDFINSHPEEDNNIEHVELRRDHELDLKRSHARIEDLQHTTTNFNAFNNKDNEQLRGDISPQTLASRDGRGWKWTQEATVVLLECMVKGDMFFKRTKRATDWKRISLEIMSKNGERPSDKQCRLRYDTLLKAYKVVKAFCEKNVKSFGEISYKERIELRLSTTLHENWYNMIEKVCNNMCYYQKPMKQMKRSPSIENGLPSRIESQITSMVHNNIVEGQQNLEHHISVKVSRSLEDEMHECKEQRLRLKFKNKLAQPIFTLDTLTSEKEEMLLVNLEDVETGEIVRTGPAAFAELEVVVLKSGLTSNAEGNWTQQEFEKHILPNVLDGVLDIKLVDGEGLIGEVKFIWNLSNWVKLGVRVSSRSYMGFRIQEAMTESFKVLPSSWKDTYLPNLDSQVWTLQNICMRQRIHNSLIAMGIFTVEDLLRQKAMGNVFPHPLIDWEETFEHGMMCKPSGKVRRYERDGHGIVFNHLFQAIGLMEEYGPFRDASSLSHNEKKLMEWLIPEALRSWEHVELDEELILPKMATERKMNKYEKISKCRKMNKYAELACRMTM